MNETETYLGVASSSDVIGRIFCYIILVSIYYVFAECTHEHSFIRVGKVTFVLK